MPKTDPSYGETDTLTEQDFLQLLEEWLKQYANRHKVWNLSLGTNDVCSLDEFSPLAEQLDKLQERYSMSFAISAGNYSTAPLLDIPRNPAQVDAVRITSPADSVLGITVGSISHVDYKERGPKEHQPSPFHATVPGRTTLSNPI